ncbi:MAG: DUF4935 domain-containing protein [Deltaproteobacteria bacterium]|nr:DUF4935 domain-containing protein [Deltaproteobacteria bacterium]
MSERVFVDTNVFLRFFVRDNEPLFQRAKSLFERAENGETRLVTNEIVVAEIVWVLESYYGFARDEIREVLDVLLDSKSLDIENGSLIRESVELYTDGKMDFIDAFNIAYIKKKGVKKVATFDRKHFRQIKGCEAVI